MKCKYHSCNNLVTKSKSNNPKVFCCDKCKNKYFVDRRRWVMKLKAIAYLGGKCSNCGYSKFPQALEFHHKDRTTKAFGLGLPHTRSWERTKKEVDKCTLLCANCHREVEVLLLTHKKEFFEEEFKGTSFHINGRVGELAESAGL